MSSFFVSMIVPLMTNIWPQLKDQVARIAQLLDSPIYQALLGPMGVIDLTTWQGAFYMYVGVTMEWAIVLLAILVPAKIVTSEVDKKTLDVTLSYPIPRWRYLLEKFMVYLAYSFLYPTFVYVLAVVDPQSIGETLDLIPRARHGRVLALALRPGCALPAVRDAVLGVEPGSERLRRPDTSPVRDDEARGPGEPGVPEGPVPLQLHEYGYHPTAGGMLMNELSLLVGVGLIALLCALYTFQKRELVF